MNNTGSESENYSVAARCGNCGHGGKITAPKGTKVEGNYACPNCGCRSFEKCWAK